MARPHTHLKQGVRCIKCWSWKIYFEALATSSKFFFKNDKETWTDKERKSSIKKLYMLIRSLGILCAYQPENLSLQHQTAQITIMSSHSKRPHGSFEDIGQCSCLLYQNMVAILRVYSFAQFIFITDTRGTLKRQLVRWHWYTWAEEPGGSAQWWPCLPPPISAPVSLPTAQLSLAGLTGKSHPTSFITSGTATENWLLHRLPNIRRDFVAYNSFEV